MMEFEPKTYEEWLEHHYKVMYPKIVKAIIDSEEAKEPGKREMIFFKAKTEKE